MPYLDIIYMPGESPNSAAQSFAEWLVPHGRTLVASAVGQVDISNNLAPHTRDQVEGRVVAGSRYDENVFGVELRLTLPPGPEDCYKRDADRIRQLLLKGLVPLIDRAEHDLATGEVSLASVGDMGVSLVFAPMAGAAIDLQTRTVGACWGGEDLQGTRLADL